MGIVVSSQPRMVAVVVKKTASTDYVVDGERVESSRVEARPDGTGNLKPGEEEEAACGGCGGGGGKKREREKREGKGSVM
jgi:hypothetical protein